MTHTEPTISVVLSVLDGERFVGRCIDMLAAQTFRPCEIVVIDDGSTDSTSTELLAARDRHGDLVRVQRHTNRGQGASLAVAHSMCTGTYIATADVDDLYPPDRLARSVELMESTGADLGGGQVDGWLDTPWRRPLRFAVSRFPTDPEGIASRIAEGLDPLPHTTMIIRRSALDRFGGYRSVPRAPDLELMLRWGLQGARIAVSPNVLASYRFRREFFSVHTQTRWMICTRYARAVAAASDDEMDDFAVWFAREPLGPARREAIVRVLRLTARLGAGMWRC